MKTKRYVIEEGNLVTCTILETNIQPDASIPTHLMQNNSTGRKFRCGLEYLPAKTPADAWKAWITQINESQKDTRIAIQTHKENLKELKKKKQEAKANYIAAHADNTKVEPSQNGEAYEAEWVSGTPRKGIDTEVVLLGNDAPDTAVMPSELEDAIQEENGNITLKDERILKVL